MPINPSDITTIRVGELTTGAITANSKIAVENDTDLEQVTGTQLIEFINTNSNAFQFEIRDLFVNQAYIDANFQINGLGTGIMEGWAICNGQNGTPPMGGLVSVGYGANYAIGGFGGSKDAVLVQHTHTFTGSEDDTGDNGGFIIVSPSNSIGLKSNLSTEGVSGTNKNMQPYIVLLKIMKL